MKRFLLCLFAIFMLSCCVIPAYADSNFKDGLKSDGKIHVYIVGDGEKVLTTESSFIWYLTYFPESCHLIINMNGKEYAYSNFPSSLWKEFKDAESIDSFYNKHIKGVSAYLIKDDYSGDNEKIVLEYISPYTFSNVQSSSVNAKDSSLYGIDDDTYKKIYEAAYADGFEEGRQAGYNVGKNTGYNEGHEDGVKEGYEVGSGKEYDSLEYLSALLEKNKQK